MIYILKNPKYLKMKNKQLNLKLKGFEYLKETIKALQMVAAPDVKELKGGLGKGSNSFSVYNIESVHTGIFTRTRRNYSTNIFRCKRYYVKFLNLVSPKVKIIMTTPKITPSIMTLSEAKEHLSDMKVKSNEAYRFLKSLCRAKKYQGGLVTNRELADAQCQYNQAENHVSDAKYEVDKLSCPLSDTQIQYMNYLGDTIMGYKSLGYPMPVELMLHIRYAFSFHKAGILDKNPWYIQDYIIKKDLNCSKFWLNNSNLFIPSKCRDMFWCDNSGSTNSKEILQTLKVTMDESIKYGNRDFYVGKGCGNDVNKVDFVVTETPFSTSDFDILDSGIKALKKSSCLGDVKLFQYKSFQTSKLLNIKKNARDFLNDISTGDGYYDINLFIRAENLKYSDGIEFKNWICKTSRENKITPMLYDLTFEENLGICDYIERSSNIGVALVKRKNKTDLAYAPGSAYEPVDVRVNAENWNPDRYLPEISKDLNPKLSMPGGSTDMWETLDYMLDILESVIWKFF